MHTNVAAATHTTPESPIAEAAPIGPRLLAFAREQLQMAADHLAREGEDRHFGIHQARKCIRRTRATLALGKRVFDRHSEALDGELGRLCRGMSALRDSQALLEEIERLEAVASAEALPILARAKVVARERREQMLERFLRRDAGLESRRRRLQHALERMGTLDWRSLDERKVVKAVKRSRRRVRKAAPRAERHPDDEKAWHIYRRRLRRLHQQHTLLATIQPGLLPPSIGQEARASALGELQDDVLLLKRCGNHSPFPAELRPVLRGIARERLQKARRG